MRHLFIRSAVLLVFLVTISSCGRKGDPIPPDKINARITIDMSRGERR